MKRFANGMTRFTISLLCAAVAIYSYRYLVRPGDLFSNIAANHFSHPWIYVHAGCASTALLLGPLQFVKRLRNRWPRFHRISGWIFMLGCFGGAGSGILLAVGVTAGPIAATGFACLGLAWFYTTARGLFSAITKDFITHRQWMIYSFALAFAAVTLRIYVPLSQILGFDIGIAYPAIAWLAWVPNIALARWYLHLPQRGVRRAGMHGA